MITRNYFKVVRVFPDPSDYFYIKNEGYESGNLYFDNYLERTDIQFKIDNGSWTNLVDYISNYQVIIFQPNSKLYLRGTAGYWRKENDGIYFYKDGDFPMSVGGDLRTLLNYTDVDSITTIPAQCFDGTFSEKNIISIDNLTLGSSVTTLGDRAFSSFFNGNANLQKGLNLSGITTIGKESMVYMYYNCSSLNEAYAPNVSTWDTHKTLVWLNGVSSTGVLYKPANLTISTDDENGVPSGWTTQTYPNA